MPTPARTSLKAIIAAAHEGTIRPGPGLVDRQTTALEVLAIEAGDGLIGLFLVLANEILCLVKLAPPCSLGQRPASQIIICVGHYVKRKTPPTNIANLA